MMMRRSDIADLATLMPLFRPRTFTALAIQMERAPAVTIIDDDLGTLAIAGMWPKDDHFEAWFAVAPRVAGTPKVIRVIRMLARAIDRLPPNIIAVLAYVAKSNLAGQRLALLLGFKPLYAEPPDDELIAFALYPCARRHKVRPQKE